MQSKKSFFVHSLVLILIFYVTPLFANAQQSNESILIQNITIISPEKEKPLENGYVLIVGKKIIDAGQGNPQPPSKGVKIIDGTGKFLIPGLIDSHVHLVSIPGLGFRHRQKSPDLVTAYFKQMPRSYLYFGYTTLIDMGSADHDLIARINKAAVHPDIYHCDASLPMANGYPMHYVPEHIRFDVFRNFLFDERQKDKIPAKYDPIAHSPKALVKAVKQAGGVAVKTFFEPGFDRPGQNLPTPTLGLMREIVIQSHENNLPLALHANSYNAHKFGVEADVDIFVHGMWRWGEYRRETKLPDALINVLDQAIEKNIGYMPTMQVIAGLKSLFEPTFLDNPNLIKVLPENLLEWYKSEEGKWFANTMQKNFDSAPTGSKVFGSVFQRGATVVDYLGEKNANILFGTDTPSAPTYANPPGLNGFLEMQNLYQAGLSLKQILLAATLSNAKAFQLEDKYGSIEKGKIANLLILDKNPLLDIEAYDQIGLVISRGEVLKRNMLQYSSH
jgi:imidazolonepropionase-like amidohydrolase